MRTFTVIVAYLAMSFFARAESLTEIVGEEAVYFARECRSISTDHFKLTHDMRPDEAAGIASLLEFAYVQFESCFGGRGFELQAPETQLEWMCFRKTDSFCDYALATESMDLSWATGYYSSRTNRVAVVRPGRIRKWYGPGKQIARTAATAEDGIEAGLVKIVHEAGHQLAFNTGLQKRGVMYPLWATEGVALVFEDCVSDYLPAGRYSDARRKRLLELYRRNELIALAEFVVMPRLPMDRPESDVYAQAWGFFVFLCENKLADLKGYLASLNSLRAGARSRYRLSGEFVESFGPIEELEKQWSFFLELATNKPFFCGTGAPLHEETLK